MSAAGTPLGDALAQQARACVELGSPFTARLMEALAEVLSPEGPLGSRLFGWPGDLSPSGDSVPLRLAGALHGLVLSNRVPGLAALWPPREAPEGDALREAVRDALAQQADLVDGALDGPPQTNEVARSAVLISAAHWLVARHPLPFRLSELGASAGLNLNFDHFALETGAARLGPEDAALTLRPDWTGPIPRPGPVRVEDRRGVDLSPIDAADPAQRRRLRSYIWADQLDRLDRLERALALPPAPVDRADVAAWLPGRLAEPWPGQVHLVYHTVAWQYFPEATRRACTAALEAAGARATPDAPLAWLGMEGDGGTPGAALGLRLWPGNQRFALGRADFHGRWVTWTGAA